MRAWIAVGLLFSVALAGCSDGGGDESDSDRDGLYAWQETHGWQVIIDLMGRRIVRDVTSDPNLQDTDGDGVPDPAEFALGLDPRDKDTDDDGLSDCQEVMHTVLSECEDDDWSGLTDGGYRTIGNRADSDPFPSRYAVEHIGMIDETGTWDGQIYGDGIPDGDEINGYEIQLSGGRTRLVTTDPLKVDSDGDALQDGEERFLYNSDPTNFDTDGDGCQDGLDVLPDVVASFDLGLQEATWAPPGRSGSADIRFALHLADNGFNHPVDGAVSMQHGQPVDLTGAAGGLGQEAVCTFPPWHPWVRISVQVVEWQSDSVVGLDFHSDDVPNDTASVWWNVRDGTFTYEPAWPSPDFSGASIFTTDDGILSWAGSDGRVSLRPAIVHV